VDGLRQHSVSPIDIEYHEAFEKMEMKSHFHNSYEIIYISEGKAEFTINKKNTSWKTTAWFL
jgi:cupin superfamily acireductone dioxygenase involved in methionine salvage